MNTDHCIFFQLAKASRAGTRHWSESVAEFGVTSVQAMVLGFLAEEDGISSGNLGNRAQLDSATLTGILDRLARSGLVERKDNPDDRRGILIYLTEKGRSVGSGIHDRIESANRSFLAGLTAEEEIIFRTLLGKLMSQVR